MPTVEINSLFLFIKFFLFLNSIILLQQFLPIFLFNLTFFMIFQSTKGFFCFLLTFFDNMVLNLSFVFKWQQMIYIFFIEFILFSSNKYILSLGFSFMSLSSHDIFLSAIFLQWTFDFISTMFFSLKFLYFYNLYCFLCFFICIFLFFIACSILTMKL